MKLYTNRFALAAAITAGVAYVLCAVFVAIFPELALQMLGWVAHIVNVEKFAGDVQITFGGVVIGLVQVVIYVYLFVLLFGAVYNSMTKSR